MTRADCDLLRAVGLDDEGILALVMLVGFFNLASRIADGLGVELDPQFGGGSSDP